MRSPYTQCIILAGVPLLPSIGLVAKTYPASLANFIDSEYRKKVSVLNLAAGYTSKRDVLAVAALFARLWCAGLQCVL